MKKNTFYVTTPIYYVNAEPHIGSLYSTLLADVISRIMKLYGKKSIFLTGTDEHGQKVYDAAHVKSITPQNFVDGLVPAFQHAWKSWNIEYDIFMRTTNKEHVHVVQEWIRSLQKKDLIYKASYEGWYSISSETFLTEKDIELRDEKGTPLCPISKKPAQWITQEAYFFRLSSFQEQLLQFYKNNPHFVTPKERIAEITSFVENGLKDLCISRSKKSLSWGISFPDDNDHVVYVWADALNNYITAIGYMQQNKKDYFNSIWPCDVHVMAKDIVRFHAVYWPAFLMASNLEMPLKLLVHGWILVDGNKMSKSLGNVITPAKLIDLYGVDKCRYYFIRHLAITQDATFSYADLEEKTNSELADALGNLLQRIIVLSQKNSLTSVSVVDTFDSLAQELYKQSLHMIAEFEKEMQEYMLHRAYGHVWHYINQINAYMHHTQPWKLSNTNKEYFSMIISAVLHALYQVAIMVSPVMPESAHKIMIALGKEKKTLSLENALKEWNQTFVIDKKPEPLFVKIEIKKEIITQEPSVQKNSYITFDDFKKIEIKVGQIISIENVKNSDKLYHLMVDFGMHGVKSVCSGIAQHITKENLFHKKAVFVFNLEPRKLCGILSEAMIMAAEDNSNKVNIVMVGDNIPNGTMVK
jgi:methionyl-tRNA synthetase